MHLSACQISIAASFGIKLADGENTSHDAALAAADAALYQAKSVGRDRVVVAEDMRSETPEPAAVRRLSA